MFERIAPNISNCTINRALQAIDNTTGAFPWCGKIHSQERNKVHIAYKEVSFMYSTNLLIKFNA